MATQQAVWGIDIGQCALKAMRIVVDPDAGEDEVKFIADAFDHIEYPKILSQPEADPVALVRDALEQFLSRNDVRNDRIAISVPGQAGLARFIKLPPVESKKIPDIVKFEAKQQIPFDLDDVIWDYQRMAGGTEEEGFSLETEVGLFAMKRDQVFAALEPLTNAGIDVDFVQLAPLAIYNFVVGDQFGGLPDIDEYDPDDPPESLIVMAMGTDTTDLVITNGFRVWQRSIPIGGNHFTKALTKELKLTFSKAEHLKRNATKADDPKAVFQAMRPVFSDLLTEIRRSVGYFMNLNREAKVKKVLVLGNAMRLPGLQKYLIQNLGYDVVEVKKFEKLSGAGVVGAPVFKENMLSFPVAYGLAIQGSGKATISTNLVPREIVRDRIIRAKKPWAVAVAALILVACTMNFYGHFRPYRAAMFEEFKPAEAEVNQIGQEYSTLASSFSQTDSKFNTIHAVEDKLQVNVDERYYPPEFVTALAAALPMDDAPAMGTPAGPQPEHRRQIHITSIQYLYEPNLSAWQQRMKTIDPRAVDKMKKERQPRKAPAAKGKGAKGKKPPKKKRVPTRNVPKVSGEGWVVRLEGYHLYNSIDKEGQDVFVKKAFLDPLPNTKIQVLDFKESRRGQRKNISLRELGFSKGVFTRINNELHPTVVYNPNSFEDPRSDRGDDNPLRFEFQVEMVFTPKKLDLRNVSDIPVPVPTLGTKPAKTQPAKTEG
jgi:type IV pilus assembly protein PilM